MPIVTLTEDNQPRYYAVTEGNECRPSALVDEYKLADSAKREYAEHTLRVEYLRRLTEHAYDCVQLGYLVQNPPDDQTLIGNTKVRERLAVKIATDAVWLRTYDPFTGLIADAVARSEFGTALQVGDECVSSLDDDSWDATKWALEASDPWRRDHEAEMAKAAAEREAARVLPPAAKKRVQKAAEAYVRAFKVATKPTKAKRAKRRAA